MKYTQNSYTPRRANDIVGERVKVYRNLHKKGVVYSIKGRDRKTETEKVLGYADDILLQNIEFRVQEGGRLKVLATGEKKVHAFAVGDVVSVDEAEIARMVKHLAASEGPWEQIRYNPKTLTTFVRAADSAPIFEALYARASGNGVSAISNLPRLAQPNVSAAMRRKIVDEMELW
jgi:hypothetical protein